MIRITIATLLFACGIFLFTSCKKNELITKPTYAIGTIVAYQKSSGDAGSDNSIVYNYTINGLQFENYYTDVQFGPKWSVPSSNYKKGSKYMVEYDAGCESGDKCNDQTESRMLFNYPVRDSADYNNYVAQFATIPPTP